MNVNKFSFYTIKISETDEFPKCICDDCWAQTENFHCFYESVRKAQIDYLLTTVKDEPTNDTSILHSIDNPINETLFEEVNIIAPKIDLGK